MKTVYPPTNTVCGGIIIDLQGVQRGFCIFEIRFFCFVVAISDLVYNVEAIHGKLQFHGHHSFFRMLLAVKEVKI